MNEKNKESYQEQYFRKKLEFKNELEEILKFLGILIGASILLTFIGFGLVGGTVYSIQHDKIDSKLKELDTKISNVEFGQNLQGQIINRMAQTYFTNNTTWYFSNIDNSK